MSSNNKEAWESLWKQAGQLWQGYFDEVGRANMESSERKIEAGKILMEKFHELKKDFYRQHIRD